MEGRKRKWEEMNADCLANILRRLAMESLLLEVPYVCKSWYSATLSPLCWRRIPFPQISLSGLSCTPRTSKECHMKYELCDTSRLRNECGIKDEVSATAFIKSLVKRSGRSVTHLRLPPCCTEEALLYVADESPNLWFLALPDYLEFDLMEIIPQLMSKWQKLESIRLPSSYKMVEILTQISIHCKNFIGLGVKLASIEEEEASAIVILVPKLKGLNIQRAEISRESLVMILKGCKELFWVDARECTGFDEGDEEILKLASRITTFSCEGSRKENNSGYMDQWRQNPYNALPILPPKKLFRT